jgi:WD40 repeat protein
LTVVCFPDDQTIASAGVDGTIQVWQRHSAQRMRSLDNHLAGVNSLALLPSSYRTQASQVGLGDGPMMVSISEDKSLRLWQPSIGRLVRFVRFSQPVCALDVSSTGAQLAVATESGEMHVLESPTLTNIYTTRVAASRIYAIALAPEGTAALVAGRDCLQRVAW